MKFSVIIVTYNSELNKIKATLESVFRQSFRDYEVIISDDGSADNHFEELRHYMEDRGFQNYRLLAHEKNMGTVRNLIAAVEAAQGTYIRDFGPGDLFYGKDSLAGLYRFMETRSCKCCFGLVRGYYMDEEDHPAAVDFYHPFDIKAYREHNRKRLRKNLVLYRDYPPGSCTSYRRDFYLRYLKELSGKVRYTEDSFQILAGMDHEFMDVFPDYLIWYETEGGVSNTGGVYSERMLADVGSFYRYLNRRHPDDRLVKKQRRVLGLYKIRNLYLRTLVRFVINPDAAVYLLRHMWQIRTHAYRPKHRTAGFLDDPEFFEKISKE